MLPSLLLIVIAIPFTLFLVSQNQDLREHAAGPIVVTTEPIDNLTVSISQKNGTTQESNQDGSNNQGSNNQSHRRGGNTDFGCLGNCPHDSGNGDNSDANSDGQKNCGNGQDINTGGQTGGSHDTNITINCNGDNQGGAQTVDKSGQDGQVSGNFGGGNQNTNTHIGKNTSGNGKHDKHQGKNGKGGSGGAGGGKGGLMGLIRQIIQRFLGH